MCWFVLKNAKYRYNVWHTAIYYTTTPYCDVISYVCCRHQGILSHSLHIFWDVYGKALVLCCPMCLQWGPCAATARAYTERATRHWKLPRRLKTDTSQLQRKKPLISSHSSQFLTDWLLPQWILVLICVSCCCCCSCSLGNGPCVVIFGLRLRTLAAKQWMALSVEATGISFEKTKILDFHLRVLFLFSCVDFHLEATAFQHLKNRREDFSSSSLCKARAELMQAVVL